MGKELQVTNNKMIKKTAVINFQGTRPLDEEFTNAYLDHGKPYNIVYERLSKICDVKMTDNPDKADIVFVWYPQTSKKIDYNRIKKKVLCFVDVETLVPDLNCYDYAIWISHDFQYKNRYFYLPASLIQTPECVRQYELMRHKHEISHVDLDMLVNRKFCSYVYSNWSHAAKEREDIFLELSKYKTVDSGGAFHNNVGGRVKNKLAFQSEHKFSIAFDNVKNSPILEKLDQAFAARTVPVYWGNKNVTKIYNPKSFINCDDFSSFVEVVKEIERIDNDDSLYKQMLLEPALLSDKSSEEWFCEFDLFLKNVVEAGLMNEKECVDYNVASVIQDFHNSGWKNYFRHRKFADIRAKILHYPWQLVKGIPFINKAGNKLIKKWYVN